MRPHSLLAIPLFLAIGISPSARPAAVPARPGPATGVQLVEMRHHYADATQLHEAVIRGDLASTRAPATRLANLPTPPGVPESASPYLEAIRAAGRRAMTAGSVADAAAATASLLQQCGACHQSQGVRPAPSASARPDVGGAVGHMLEHQGAVDQLLRGLVLPSQTEWQQGMERLRRAPLKKDELPVQGEMTNRLIQQEKTVHDLAARAAADTAATQRAQDYAVVLGACASCHSLHARVWGPGSGR